jgi:hypothetical protein
MVLQAATQHASVYADGAVDSARELVRHSLRSELSAIESAYLGAVSDGAHVANIVRIADRLTALHSGTLASGRFRLGPAQKALNLLLKLQWCCGWIPTPPHCPFDAIIIKQLDLDGSVAWTKLDSIQEYGKLVAAARGKAGEMSLSAWELLAYNQAAPASRRANTLSPSNEH